MVNTTVFHPDQLATLVEEAHQTLLGAIRASGEDHGQRLQAIPNTDWQTAATHLLLMRRTSLLSVLSDDGLVAVASGQLDLGLLVRCTVDDFLEQAREQSQNLSDEQRMQQAIEAVASLRFNLNLRRHSEYGLISLQATDLGDALRDAFNAGRDSAGPEAGT